MAPATPSTCIEYREWKTNLEKVEENLKNGEKWTSAVIREIFGQMRMLHWWFTVSFELAKGEKADWTAWKDEVVEEWSRRYPDDLPMLFRWMADDLERVYKQEVPMKVLSLDPLTPLLSPFTPHPTLLATTRPA
jgi:hypothetical protein